MQKEYLTRPTISIESSPLNSEFWILSLQCERNTKNKRKLVAKKSEIRDDRCPLLKSSVGFCMYIATEDGMTHDDRELT